MTAKRMVIIGVDPDSSRHGVAVYLDGKIYDIRSASLFELFDIVKSFCSLSDVQIHIEDVCAINATFGKQHVKNARSATTISRSLGMCQQAQKEVERMAEYVGVPVFKHPISKNWKESAAGSRALAKIGWHKSSNEDSRSAAYFGYLGVQQWLSTTTAN